MCSAVTCRGERNGPHRSRLTTFTGSAKRLALAGRRRLGWLSFHMAAEASNPLAERLTAALTPPPPGVVAAYLFGSSARGTATERSDVDVGLLYEHTPPSTFHGQPYLLQADLTQELSRDVQLVVLNGAPVDLVHRVLRDGILIFDTNPGVHIAFEVKARNEYFDLLPVLERYRQVRTAT